MKHHLSLLLAALLVPGLLHAQDKAPTRGKILILETERTLEGDIERVGDRYCVKRSIGETWVPATQVLRLCETKQDAYKYLASQRNLHDPDERLRLAKWCHLQGLPAEALTEARAAVKLRPEHPESRRLLQHFEEAARNTTQSATTQNPATRPARPKELPLTVSAESLNQFATRIQPILMNTCVNCHSDDKAVKFQLHRVYEVGLTNNNAIQDNLAAVLGQLNVAEPQQSPLLIKAVSAHGPTGKSPLTGRQSAAFKSLEDWVKLTVSNQLPLVERAPIQAVDHLTPAPVLGGHRTGEKESDTVGPKREPQVHGEPDAPPPTSTFGAVNEKKPAAPIVPEPIDEFDPVIFNRQMHPQSPPKEAEKPK
jgi:hypothetical protein